MLIISCSPNTEQEKRILGQWEGADWLIEGKSAIDDPTLVQFEFVEGNVYKAQFGSQEEVGTFRMADTKLYTTAKGQLEKMTNFTKITQDTLIMDMNRGGREETLILIRKQ